MTQNLKIEVLTGDISIDGMVVTNLVTKEELSTAIVKKADLGTDGKIPTSQLPAEIVNTAGIVDEVKLQLETSIKDAVDESNAYAESYTDNAVSSKADLVSGKVPLEQLPTIDQYPQFGTSLTDLSTAIMKDVRARTDELEKTKASLGEDGKVLRELIPSYEKISGLPEQLELMSTQTAAVSKELGGHKVQTADLIDALEENIEANVQQLTDRQSHLMRTYATKELGVDSKVGVKPGEYFYVRSANEEEMMIEYRNVSGSAVETGKAFPNSKHKPTVFCDTVSQLRAISPRADGAVMFVKSHSNNGSGGLIYTWDSSSVATDDDGWIIKSNLFDTGRWVADFGNSPVTPQHFGAIGDGSIDERLICEKSIVAASKTSKHWLVPFGKTYLLNSYATYSEIANLTASMLPILSNVKYEVQGTLMVGSYFDDRAFLVFTDVNGTVGNFIPVRNWKMFGTGDIDLSLSGKRRTVFNSRIPIYLETSYDASIATIKIHSGDIPNAIVTGGENITIDGVRFIDLMQDNSANDDHSSIYAKARRTHIKNCYFKMSSINGNLNACPVELHNSDSSFKDSVIDGYRNTHILAAITVEFPYIENLEVSGLKAKVHRNFANLDVWTGSVISNVKVHDNVCRMLPFPSDAAITAAGLTPAYTVAAQAMLHVTNDSALGYDLRAGIGASVQYYDNTYVSYVDTQIPDNLRAAVYFAKAPISGISVFRNTIRAKNIVLASPELNTTDKLNLDNFTIMDNDFDEVFLATDKLINLNVVSLQSSVFDLKFKREFYCNNLINISVINVPLSAANNFVVHPQNTSQITKCVNVTAAVLQNPSNRISYPETVSVYFGSDVVGESNFYINNVKTARIISRGGIPDNIIFSDFISNNSDNKLVAMCRNPTGSYGTYNARLLLEN